MNSFVNRFNAIGGFAHELNTGLAVQDGFQPFQDDRLSVSD
jgi:hypothetical protein